MKEAEKNVVKGQSSWIMSNNNVELAITEQGGQMAPVTFYRDSDKPVQPYYINPWHEEDIAIDEPLFKPLRGDFFCMPFGAVNNYEGEHHPIHGEPSTDKWDFFGLSKTDGITKLELGMKTKIRSGKVKKSIQLIDNHNSLYIQHELSGYSGEMTLGHHQILALPEEKGSVRVSTSPIHFGMTMERDYLSCFIDEYYALKPGQKFKDPKKVATIWKDEPFADLTSFPARKGFMDVAALYSKQGSDPSWTTAAVPSMGYLWFSLKDPKVLPQTLMWISNGGRHASPWSGRNLCLGLEDTCGCFADGLTKSAENNIVNKNGIPTIINLDPEKPLIVNSIQGVVKIPQSFTKVKAIQFKENKLVFISVDGIGVETDVNWDFFNTGKIIV